VEKSCNFAVTSSQLYCCPSSELHSLSLCICISILKKTLYAVFSLYTETEPIGDSKNSCRQQESAKRSWWTLRRDDSWPWQVKPPVWNGGRYLPSVEMASEGHLL